LKSNILNLHFSTQQISLTGFFPLYYSDMNTTSPEKPIRLSYRRIYILPTKRGLGLVMLIALLLLIAFIYNNNLVYLLSFLLASLFFITILHTVKSLEGLVIRKGYSANVFAGEFAQSNVIIENPANVTRYGVQLGLDKDKMQVVEIKARQSVRVSLAQRVNKRGWFIVNKPTIASCYPFGLFRAWNSLDIELKTLVYPQPVMQDCPLPENNDGDGGQGNAEKGQDDFYGFQNYQTGDSIRHIHWRAFAKGQGLFVRQYSGVQNSEIWLDYAQTTGIGKEERLSQMCRWVLDADKAEVAYGFRMAGLTIEPNRGDSHSTQCLEALALA